jgi:outer membrane protein OmpA-like peptidoglycan-associated protein
MKKVSILLIVLSAFVFPSFAQENLAEAVTRSTAGDNWFISIGGSANLLHGEQDKVAKALDRIKYGGEFTVGKWFNPYFGARIAANYGFLRGFNFGSSRGGEYTSTDDGRGRFPMGGDPGTWYTNANPKYDYYDNATGKKGSDLSGFWQDFNYSTVTLDFMANFSNLLYGHYSDRLVNISPIVGVGVINAYNNEVTTPSFYFAVAKIGINVDFRITRNFSIYLEPKGYVTSNEFDGYIGNSLVDGLTSLSLGAKFTFNNKYSNIGQLTLDEIDNLNDRVNANRELIDNHQEILERQQDLLEKLRKCCEEKPVVVVEPKENIPLPEYIRFHLDSYKIEKVEYSKIDGVIKYLNTNPNSKLLIVGYADKLTGNSPYNLKLSKKRVESVAEELKKKGVMSKRINIDWKGDKEQPFAENDWNRVVIVIEQK